MERLKQKSTILIMSNNNIMNDEADFNGNIKRMHVAPLKSLNK